MARADMMDICLIDGMQRVRTLRMLQVYWNNEHPRFPDGGKMSQHLESLPIGGEMEVKGPLGHVHYLGRNKYAPDFSPLLPTDSLLVATSCTS